MADSRPESQRQGHKPIEVGDDKAQILKERMFLVTFFLGGVALVAGMFWIADGLSTNFKVGSATFIVMAVTGGLSIANSLVSRFAIKT